MRRSVQGNVQTILWEARQWSGMEYLRLEERASEIIADGTIIMLENDLPLRIHYRIHCDSGWAVKEIHIDLLGKTGSSLHLDADRRGHWTAEGNLLPSLDGCIDVDIAATPFTNTLPIRRLNLKQDESAEIKVAYITIPELAYYTARQRYTCLEARPEGGRYRYESLDSGFTAELTIDANGLVIDYAEIWRRLWPR